MPIVFEMPKENLIIIRGEKMIFYLIIRPLII